MEASTIEKVKKLKDLIDGTNVNQAAKTREAKAEKTKAKKTLTPDAPPTETETTTDETKTNSVSKQSFDARFNNFRSLITLLETDATYATNVEDLKIEALNAFALTLKAANNETNDAFDLLAIKRGERNEMFYGAGDSVITVVNLIKNELDSMGGKESADYKKVSDYRFVNLGD